MAFSYINCYFIAHTNINSKWQTSLIMSQHSGQDIPRQQLPTPALEQALFFNWRLIPPSPPWNAISFASFQGWGRSFEQLVHPWTECGSNMSMVGCRSGHGRRRQTENGGCEQHTRATCCRVVLYLETETNRIQKHRDRTDKRQAKVWLAQSLRIWCTVCSVYSHISCSHTLVIVLIEGTRLLWSACLHHCSRVPPIMNSCQLASITTLIS